MSTEPARDPSLARLLARLQRTAEAYRKSDQFAYSRGYLEGLNHAALAVQEEMGPQVVKTQRRPDIDIDECDNCSEVASDGDQGAARVVYTIGDTSAEGLLCGDCINAADADTCVKCNAVWWTGVTPPYDEDNCPGSVCGSCWSEATR